MTSVLKALAEVSVYSAAVLVIILVFKTIFKKRISAKLQYAAWILLIFRLMLPVTPESGFHFEMLIPKSAPVSNTAEAPDSSAVYKTENTRNVRFKSSDDAYSPSSPSGNTANNIAPHLPRTSSKSANPWEIAGYAWLIGAAAYMSAMAYAHIKIIRKYKRSVILSPQWVKELYAEISKRLSITAPRFIIVKENISPALTFDAHGLLVVLPYRIAGDKTALEYAILHELTHFKRRDYIILPVTMLLRAIYWFNPAAHIGFAEMIKDMEAACDADVLAAIDPSRKKEYFCTLIGMFSHEFSSALCMAGVRTMRAAKRRINDAFMKKRTSRFIRTVSAAAAALTLLVCFTTACQPTPKNPIVIKKTGESFVSTATAAPEKIGESLYERLGAPESLNIQTKTSSGITISASNAPVILPSVSELPIAEAELKGITQEDIYKAERAVFGGADIRWHDDSVRSKEYLEREIIAAKQNLAGLESRGDDEIYIQKARNIIEYLQNEYISAPSESELEEKTLGLEKIENNGKTFNGVNVSANIDGENWIFHADENEIYISQSNIPAVNPRFGGIDAEMPYGVSISREDAIKKASEAVAQITDELKYCFCAPTAAYKGEINRNWGWAVMFMREVNGMGTAFASEEIGMDMESTVNNPVPYEKITVVVDDLGICSFSWKSPMTVTGIINGNADIMDFDGIWTETAKQLNARYSFTSESDPEAHINVDRMQLGLWRVARENGGYYYTPVWHIYTHLEHSDAYKANAKKPDSFGESFTAWDENGDPYGLSDSYPDAFGSITLNAVDGSVINKDSGY